MKALEEALNSPQPTLTTHTSGLYSSKQPVSLINQIDQV